jgi:oligopeptide transport system substrate-binding protein
MYPTSENGKVIAEAIHKMWRSQLGINVELVNEEWKAYLDSMNTLNYHLALSIWVGDYVDLNTFLDMFETDNSNNRTGWSNPEYDQLLKQAALTGDQVESQALFQKMEAILVNEAPMLPVYFHTSVVLMNPSVKGWYPTILDNHSYKYVCLEANRAEISRAEIQRRKNLAYKYWLRNWNRARRAPNTDGFLSFDALVLSNLS